MEAADGGRGQQRGDEEQRVQPPPVLKSARTHVNGLERLGGVPSLGELEIAVGHQPPMFWRSLPGLKRIVRPGGIRTSLPVRGLRPMPRLRGFTWNTPNPRSSIRSPRCIDKRIASNTASTATSALTLVISATRDTSFTMSTLIMFRRSWGSLTSIYSVTYTVNTGANCVSR